MRIIVFLTAGGNPVKKMIEMRDHKDRGIAKGPRRPDGVHLEVFTRKDKKRASTHLDILGKGKDIAVQEPWCTAHKVKRWGKRDVTRGIPQGRGANSRVASLLKGIGMFVSGVRTSCFSTSTPLYGRINDHQNRDESDGNLKVCWVWGDERGV